MTNKIIEKDERTTFIENTSYSFGYKFIAYALFIDVIYRGLRFNEAAWDLLAIVIIGGFVSTIYQYKQKILAKSWLKVVAFSSVIAFIIAFLMVIVLRKF